MRPTSLTAIFLALFSLLSTFAFAAPVAPQGVTIKRDCTLEGCRFSEVTTPSTSNTPDSGTIIGIVLELLKLIPAVQPAPPAAVPSPAPTPVPTGV